MFRTFVNNIFLILISFYTVCFSSCTLFRPLPLEPVHNSDSVQRIDKSDLSKFNGHYQILSVDSNSGELDYAFTYKPIFNRENLPGKNDYINLSVIDDRHIKATLFVNDKMVKSKTIKGNISNNYFEFHTSYLKFRFIINDYEQQSNRIALSKEGDLYLDTNRGGAAFLIIIPIPLSGSSMDTYNLKFKRKN